jgi:hypothetical protein
MTKEGKQITADVARIVLGFLFVATVIILAMEFGG